MIDSSNWKCLHNTSSMTHSSCILCLMRCQRNTSFPAATQNARARRSGQCFESTTRKVQIAIELLVFRDAVYLRWKFTSDYFSGWRLSLSNLDQYRAQYQTSCSEAEPELLLTSVTYQPVGLFDVRWRHTLTSQVLPLASHSRHARTFHICTFTQWLIVLSFYPSIRLRTELLLIWMFSNRRRTNTTLIADRVSCHAANSSSSTRYACAVSHNSIKPESTDGSIWFAMRW